MKVIIRPILAPQRKIDVTHRLVSAIAEELWRLFGGNDQLNWLEAELHLERIIAEARAEARMTEPVLTAPSAQAQETPRGALPARRERATAERRRSRKRGRAEPRNGTVTGAVSQPGSPRRDVRQLVNAGRPGTDMDSGTSHSTKGTHHEHQHETEQEGRRTCEPVGATEDCARDMHDR